MSYPNPTPPSSVPVDIGHPLVVVHNHTTATLPFTGGDVVVIVMFAILALVIGGMLWYNARHKNDEVTV